ncbi:MAG: GGDEF domain-containing protein [candidate division Zixibacteria bacterium]
MISSPSRKSYLLAIFTLALLLLATFFIVQSTPALIGLGFLLIASITLISVYHLKSSKMTRIVEKLYDVERSRDRSIATTFKAELLATPGEHKPRILQTAELLATNFNLERFAVFFRERDKYIPKLYKGFHLSDFIRPKAARVRYLMKDISESGAILKNSEIFGFLFKKKDWEYFEAPVAFCCRWGRFNSMIFVTDDESGLFSETIADPEFNSNFWPFLGSMLSQDEKLKDSMTENNKLKKEISTAKKDISGLNRDMNQKLSDLHSFVEFSGELYTIFNEDQLFKTLQNTVREKLGATKTEILCSDGDGKFVRPDSEQTDKQNENNLFVKSDSRFYKMLVENAKPLLLPVIGSGLEGDPNLDHVIKNGYQIASALKVGNQTGCILLISGREDKNQYTTADIDFLSTITNIASLSLENVRQYTTIEKLSYTDSMTGVYNYRYFYKRLIEEILRAKRFNRDMSLVILDIDNFKLFNDKYGHQTGDMVLKRLANIITGTVRSIDVVSRYGGEEFCIIMPDTNAENCAKFIERLRAEIAGLRLETNVVQDDSVVTASVGGAIFPSHANNADRLIYCADMALLKAKATGRNLAIMYLPDFTDKEESSIGGM